MTTITDQATINAIQAAYNAASISGNWQTAYQLVFDAITTETFIQDPSGATFDQFNPSAGVDPAVWIWVAAAQKVNSNTRAFAHPLPHYTSPPTPDYRRVIP